jgi:hypothetical protein
MQNYPKPAEAAELRGDQAVGKVVQRDHGDANSANPANREPDEH